MKRFISVLVSFLLVWSLGMMTVSAADISDVYGSRDEVESVSETEIVMDAGTEPEDADAEAGTYGEDIYYDQPEEADAGDSEYDEYDHSISVSDVSESTDEPADPEDQQADSEEDEEPEGEDIPDIEVEMCLHYDDRYSFEDAYPGYIIASIETETVTSYQVSEGNVTADPDESVVDKKSDSNTDIIAAGIGTAKVHLVSETDPDTETGICVTVTVTPAKLTLMLLAGQSNMEGYCSSSTGYEREKSIACEDGAVYSTYAPSSVSVGQSVSGYTFSGGLTSSNAADFVAGSLTGDVSISGKTLTYPLDSLTGNGYGKTGPDSGLAYEWNRLTNDKVWVVNAAHGNTNISSWIPGAAYYDRAKAVFQAAEKTYYSEIQAGHYEKGKTLVFWLQGELGDRTMSADTYESYFCQMYEGMISDFSPDEIGIIIARASTGSYTNADDIAMTGPRIAQYAIGASSAYPEVYVVSNANEQWVSDSGVKNYFASAYSASGKLDYPMQGSSASSLPTAVAEVHSDIHYSQIGHNENGITAAYGIYCAMQGSGSEPAVLWKNAAGETVNSVTLEVDEDDYTVIVLVTDPVWQAKGLSFVASTVSSYSGLDDIISYDSGTGIVEVLDSGTAAITAYDPGGNKISSIDITVTRINDLTDVAGDSYTGMYKYDGSWYYLVNGWIQTDFTGLSNCADSNGDWWHLTNGKADTYNGFAENKNGWWYVENGRVIFSKNSVIRDEEKAISGSGDWWYVTGGKVQTGFTGLADYSNANGWWYINDGKVDFTYNGFAENKNGWWYLENSKVMFSKNSVIHDTKKVIDGAADWWYVTGGKVQTGFTGLANYSNSNGWWYIKNGKVDFTANTVAQNKNGWWYVTNGKVQFSFTGLANYSNSNGWWYIKNGKVDFTANTVAHNKNGWWYVTNGKVQFGFTGLANYSNANGWWYIKNGKVDFSYSGTAQNKNGTWFLRNGKVDFTYTGKVTEGKDTYSVVNGKASLMSKNNKR